MSINQVQQIREDTECQEKSTVQASNTPPAANANTIATNAIKQQKNLEEIEYE